MTETQNEIEAEVQRLVDMGATIDFQVFDANGDTATQIAQIQTMIDQEYDICLLIAGSATALDQVVESAHAAGVIVVNWDSLVSTDQLTAIVNTDQIKWGNMTAQWLVDAIGGSGPILAINGPAGISVSEARWAGAKEIFDANPDVEIVGTANIEYNEAPALTEMESLLAAHPDVVGIWFQAGAHASAGLKTLQAMGLPFVPMTGENYNAYLLQWCDLLESGFSSFATAQVNYMAVISLDLAILAKQGQAVPSFVEVPLPEITDENVCEWAEHRAAGRLVLDPRSSGTGRAPGDHRRRHGRREPPPRRHQPANPRLHATPASGFRERGAFVPRSSERGTSFTVHRVSR